MEDLISYKQVEDSDTVYIYDIHHISNIINSSMILDSVKMNSSNDTIEYHRSGRSHGRSMMWNTILHIYDLFNKFKSQNIEFIYIFRSSMDLLWFECISENFGKIIDKTNYHIKIQIDQ